MTAAAVMTYDSLVESIKQYSDKVSDDELIAEIPSLIMLAEVEVATDLKVLGNELVVQSTLIAGNPVIEKPSYWRNTVSFSVNLPTGWTTLHKRTLEYLRNYAPDPNAQGAPRFYAEYNINNFLIAPAAAGNYDFELVYNARLDPLSSANQTNWLTGNAPQLLLYNCMKHAQLFLKNYEESDRWGGQYMAALSSMTSEDARRSSDRSTNEG